MKEHPRFIVTCGGTAGHINPAIAIANAIKANCPGAEILFVGTEDGRENDLVSRAGYRIVHVNVMGIQRSLTFSNVKALCLAATSPIKAEKMLRDWRADFVIGTGGYACWPMLKAASKLGIPCAVHESNVVPGMAVRKLQKKVDRIYTNFPETTDKLLPEVGTKIKRVGNPLLDGFLTTDREEARRTLGIDDRAFMVLSFGGSLGSATINREMMDTVERLSPLYPEIAWFHATGNRYYDAAMSDLADRKLADLPSVHWSKYIYKMPLHMAAADVVICRSGAITLAELAGLHKPAILIPSPNVVENHQFKNARALADAGAAYLLDEMTLSDNKLAGVLVDLMQSPEKCRAMGEAIGSFASVDAADKIWQDICCLMA